MKSNKLYNDDLDFTNIVMNQIILIVNIRIHVRIMHTYACISLSIISSTLTNHVKCINHAIHVYLINHITVNIVTHHNSSLYSIIILTV